MCTILTTWALNLFHTSYDPDSLYPACPRRPTHSKMSHAHNHHHQDSLVFIHNPYLCDLIETSSSHLSGRRLTVRALAYAIWSDCVDAMDISLDDIVGEIIEHEQGTDFTDYYDCYSSDNGDDEEEELAYEGDDEYDSDDEGSLWLDFYREEGLSVGGEYHAFLCEVEDGSDDNNDVEYYPGAYPSHVHQYDGDEDDSASILFCHESDEDDRSSVWSNGSTEFGMAVNYYLGR